MTPTKFHICQSDLVSLGEADRHTVLREIKEFGFTKVRFEVPLHAQTFPQQPYPWEPLRKTLIALESAGLDYLPVLGAHQPLFWKVTSDQYAKWCVTALNYMRDTTTKLPAQVEVWNEPNLTNFWANADPVTFYPFAQKAYDSIKTVFPTVEVVLAGMAACATGKRLWVFPGPKDPVSFVTQLHDKAQGRKFYDRLAYHPYSFDVGGITGMTPKPPTAEVFGIKALSRMQELTPDVEVLVTEVGHSNKGEAQKAVDLGKHMFMLDKPGHNRAEVYLYCWRDTGGEKFGFVDTKNVPKNPYHDLVRELVRFGRQLEDER